MGTQHQFWPLQVHMVTFSIETYHFSTVEAKIFTHNEEPLLVSSLIHSYYILAEFFHTLSLLL